MARGIQLAYQLAKDHFIEGGINRVILATDGDFNVGINQVDKLKTFIEDKRSSGVELSVLGFGHGNLRDDMMKNLAQHGNGNYAYIDSLSEARKALVSELDSTLVTIAKDVKLQLHFNPEVVKSFRQLGYENRTLEHRDFDNDKKDAGEIGAGHTVTALYEIEFHKGQETSLDLGELALRHKAPQGETSTRVDLELSEEIELKSDITWASVMAAFAQKLRNSSQTENLRMEPLIKMAKQAKGDDLYGYRSEAIKLMFQFLDLNNTDNIGNDPYPKWENRK